MVKILAFDTETNTNTMLMRKKNSKKLLSFVDYKNNNSLWSTYINICPSIIQLSYVLYDTSNSSSSKIFNKYIDIPDNITITEETIKIHHITRETILNASNVNKAKIDDALNEFMNDFSKADVVVGHNVQFDRTMIIAELIRTSKEDKVQKIKQIKQMMNNNNFACTMKITTPILKQVLHVTKKTEDQKVFKYPKLIEAYKYYFGYEPNKKFLHNALIDAIVCLRVYCMSLNNGFDICGTNKIITNYIKKISPLGYTCDTAKKCKTKKCKTKKCKTKKVFKNREKQ